MFPRKIKIIDNDDLRTEICKAYDMQTSIALTKWSLRIAKRSIETSNLFIDKFPVVKIAFQMNEKWQNHEASIVDLRKLCFEIHRTARIQKDEITKIVFRVIGHAVASAHMKEHAIVASDYAIKLINLIFPHNLEKIIEERKIQLKELNSL